MLGFSGPHGTGKTTIAKEVSEKYNLPMLTSQAGPIRARLGFDMKAELTIPQRIELQMAILEDFASSLAKCKAPHVTDRTPLDLAAYLLADFTATAGTPEDQAKVGSYINACLHLTDRFYHAIIVVQPGIPYEDTPMRPAPNVAYQEHHLHLVLGLAARLSHPTLALLPRPLIDHNARVDVVSQAWEHVQAKTRQYVSGFTRH